MKIRRPHHRRRPPPVDNGNENPPAPPPPPPPPATDLECPGKGCPQPPGGQTGETDDGQEDNVAITAARVQSAPTDDTAATEELGLSEELAESDSTELKSSGNARKRLFVATAPSGNSVKITGERLKSTLQGYCVRCDFIGWGGVETKAKRGSETPSFTIFGGKRFDRDDVGKAQGGRGLDRSFAVELPDNLADLDLLKGMLPGAGVKGQFNLPANARASTEPSAKRAAQLGDGPRSPARHRRPRHRLPPVG